MSNRQRTAMTRLAARLKSRSGESLVYRRGGNSVNLTGTVGENEHEDSSVEMVIHLIKSVDFIITAADLVIDSELTTPQKGDLIEGDGDVYEVLPHGEQKQTWRYSGPFKTVIRIHTKKIGTV
jgi:hypothetical protein